MSGIVLSSSVRQNLLSLQSTADLLATTQNRLSTGKKVNSALDNPTNFFTAASLDSRASDISNLLDGIGNGVQVLQAANTGISSLSKLVDTAKSIATQALQTTVGYSTKSNVSATIAGATATDLRGTTTFTSADAIGSVIYDGTAGGTTAVSSTDTLGGAIAALTGTATTPAIKTNTLVTLGGALHTGAAAAVAVGTDLLCALSSGGSVTPTGPVAGDVVTINGKTITFGATGASTADASGNYTIGINQTVSSLLSTIDSITGTAVASSIDGAGKLNINTGTNADFVSSNTTGTPLAELGLTAGTTARGASTAALSATSKLFSPLNGSPALSTTAITDGTTLNVNGKTITFKASAAPAAASLPAGSGVLGNIVSDGAGNSTIYLGTSSTTTTATLGDVLTAVDLASGVKSATNTAGVAAFTTNSGQTASSVSGGGAVSLQSSTGQDLSVTGSADFLKSIGLTTASGGGATTVVAHRTTSGSTVGALIADGSTLQVNGKTITFKNAATPAASATHTGISGNVETDGTGNSTVYLQSGTVADVLKAIDLATGVQTAALGVSGAALTTATGQANSTVNSSGVLNISTGTISDLAVTGTGNALSVLGLTGPTGNNTSFNAARTAGAGGINGTTLTFGSFNGGAAVNVTFGDGTGGTVKTLDQLNTHLQANNLTATLDSVGKLTISATNDYASSTLGSVVSGGVIGGTITHALSFSTASGPVIDSSAQAVRSNLVSQYNNILAQITTTAQDASFNGVNLLAGDQLKLTFNETGKSNLNITGVTFNAAGLGLANLSSGVDFIDNAATNNVVASLNSASTALRSQASALGSNLSIVQIRQDFSKNLINVLQTGSSNLTLADTNEEAANSQALSTRQSIAVSALALANQSQQSVLQLLR
jgi:flagellin-like hook-associated protein FlgL